MIESPNLYLGATVNYTVGNEELQESLAEQDISWRIFYIDEENIYLIASNFFLSEYAPDSMSGDSVVFGNYTILPYYASSDYSGSAINWDSKVSKWNSLYIEKYPSSSLSKNQVVAYFLDTDLWSDFSNTLYTDYAIGTPTIELWVASWNEYGYDEITLEVNSKEGYSINKDSYVAPYESEGYNNDLYFPSTFNTDWDDYFIASPSSNGSSPILMITNDGTISHIAHTSNSCFRPIVCLSYDTELLENEDGTYDIIEK